MENNGKKKTISFSQISMYNDCQYKWFLTYVKKLGTGDQTIHLIFGSAMHTVLQAYLKTMYNESAKVADTIDVYKMLHEELSKEFVKSSETMGKFLCTKEELMEFYMDGIAILDFFKKHRGDYFNKKGFELAGIEVPLRVDTGNNTVFSGFIDIIIRDTISGKVKIIDFKTSTMGWRDYQKNNDNKTSQLILYKKFYSDTHSIPIDMIDVEFIILKRKLYENMDYPQKRIQRFSPPSGKPTINKVSSTLNEFISACFDTSGAYIENRKYLKAEDLKKCKYCEFAGKIEICDQKN
jgi:hypothetical protein